MEKTILYFEKPGKVNTDETLSIARSRAEQLGIRQVVVASTHGYTARRAKETFDGLNAEIIAVSINAGFDDEGWTMSDAERDALRKRGIKVLTSVHTLSGADTAIVLRPTYSRRFKKLRIREILAKPR